MKIAVIGNREFQDYGLLCRILNGFTFSVLISGGAKGTDTLAERFARENNIETLILKPDYKAFGRPAPFIRNRAMVDACDQVIAFWDGRDGGTKYTVKHARKKNKPVTVIQI